MQLNPNHKRIVLFLLILSILPYLFISIYTNPGADDFMYGYLGKKDPLIKNLLYQYHFWSGRYTANIFVLTGPLSFNSLVIYKIIPIILIMLTISGFSFMLKSIIGKGITTLDNYIISISLGLLYLHQMPTIGEGFYWYTGSVTYQLGNIFAIIYLSLLFRLSEKNYLLSNKIIHLALTSSIALVAIGFNEVLMILILLFSLLVLCISVYKKSNFKIWAAYFIFICACFAAISILAPGNYVRGSFYPEKHQFFHSLLYSIAQTGRFFLIWTSSAPLFIMSVIFYYFNKKLSASVPIFSASFYLHPIVSTCLLFFIIFASVFPAYWVTGILGQHRTLNIAYFFFIILWFINLNVWFNFFKQKLNYQQTLSLKSIYFLVLITLGCFLFAKNGFDCCSDIITGRARSYDTQMKKRYSIVEESKDTIFFSPIIDPPRSFHVYDITNDHHSWFNTCWALYFNCENKPVIKK